MREFEGYAAAPVSTDVNESGECDGDEEDGDEEGIDDDEVRYRVEELPLVQRTLLLMNQSLATTKLGLQVLTVVGDALCKVADTSGVELDTLLRTLSISSNGPVVASLSSSSAPTNADGNTSADDDRLYTPSSDLTGRFTADRSGLMLWISEMVRVRKRLLDALTDLGCELYPPVEAVDIKQLYATTLHYSRLLLGLLQHPSYQTLLSEELVSKLAATSSQLNSMAS